MVTFECHQDGTFFFLAVARATDATRQAATTHHSDRGSTYASEDYRDVLEANGITCSMSRRGNCLDNAAMESWNSTLKAELGEHFAGSEDAHRKLFDYIEVFDNQERMHSSLDDASPAEFERKLLYVPEAA